MRLTIPVTTPFPGRARRLARLAIAAVAAAGFLASGSTAFAAAPANDNYLSALPVPGDHFDTMIDTTGATDQPNLFDPATPDKVVVGNQAEALSCNGQAYGKTVWFELRPQQGGGVRITASGYDAVVAVYEYDPKSATIVRPLGCQDASKTTTEQLDVPAPGLEAGHIYAIQVGGVVAGGVAQSGTLNFALQFFGDRDGDGIVDASDPCPDAPGARGGCPPQIPGTPRLAVAGLKIVLLEWAGLARGTEVRAQCSACGGHGVSQTVRVRAGGTARLTAFDNASARKGAVLRVFARTRPPAKGSRGSAAAKASMAIGKSARYRFGSGSYRWAMGCLLPGSWKTPIACPR